MKKANNLACLFAVLIVILTIEALLCCANAGEFNGKEVFTAKEVELFSFERHDGDLLNLDHPMYRVGEILICANRYVVPVGYKWARNHWEYDVVDVKVGKR